MNRRLRTMLAAVGGVCVAVAAAVAASGWAKPDFLRREVRSEIDIAAPPEAVWTELTDFGSYPEWNRFIPLAEGRLETGARLNVITRTRTAEAKVRPMIVQHAPGAGFAWRGVLVSPGVLSVLHSFQLVELPNGCTRLHHVEIFDGLLTPFVGDELEEVAVSFDEMNLALKQRAEARAGSGNCLTGPPPRAP